MIYVKNTFLGNIGIKAAEGKIVLVSFRPDESAEAVSAFSDEMSDVVAEAFSQLEAYLNGRLKVFSLPLAPEGTEFMKAVWTALLDIPFGRMSSYKDVARAIGNEKAVRAVGLANHRNPIPIFIPCHRVIGSGGSLVGYAGGLEMKKKLLELESFRTGFGL